MFGGEAPLGIFIYCRQVEYTQFEVHRSDEYFSPRDLRLDTCQAAFISVRPQTLVRKHAVGPAAVNELPQ